MRCKILLHILALGFFLTRCNKNESSLEGTTLLVDYPSGSALSHIGNRIYLAGDDASTMLVMDEHFAVIGKVRVAQGNEQRIPKKIKQDLEAMAVLRTGKKTSLLLIGSGSLAPYRNFCQLILPGSPYKSTYNLGAFYQRLQQQGIQQVNIEGATAIPGGILLASRGSKGFPRNHLVFTGTSFYQQPDSASFSIIRVGTNTDTAVFNGISGLDYAKGSDKLLMTVSTENTYNSFSDGSIGKSYLWIINDITTRRRISHINPDKVIDLDKLDARFQGHKIESVCILKETREELLLALAADDDKGQTLLFRLRLKK